MKTFTALLVLSALSSAAFAAEKPLFNGKDLTGWEGNAALWSVQDGLLTGKANHTPETKINHNTFLVWKDGKVGDFELTLKYKIIGGNSGVQYRSKLEPDGKFGPVVKGYQADFEAGKTYSGILYEERGRGILAQRGQKVTIEKDAKPVEAGKVGDSNEIQATIKSEDWNEYKVVAKGNHLQHFINGKQTVDVTDNDDVKGAKEGILALQIHTGGPMTVQFKDIILKTE